MASPIGSPNNQGNGDQQFKAWVLQTIREEIANARRGGVGLHVDGATGDLVASDGKKVRSDNFVPGSSGWGLQPNGNAEFNDLTLRGGIIGNAALTTPATFGSGGNSSSGFAVTTTVKTTATGSASSISVPIPAGYTQALVHCTVNAQANNPTAAYDYLYVSAIIDTPSGHGGVGGEAFDGVAAGGWAHAAASASGTYSTIGTGSIVASCAVRSGAAWAAQASNTANVDVTVIFLR